MKNKVENATCQAFGICINGREKIIKTNPVKSLGFLIVLFLKTHLFNKKASIEYINSNPPILNILNNILTLPCFQNLIYINNDRFFLLDW